MVAIKDFEIPKSCYMCHFCIDYGIHGRCDLTNADVTICGDNDKRADDCPLVEIKENKDGEENN